MCKVGKRVRDTNKKNIHQIVIKVKWKIGFSVNGFGLMKLCRGVISWIKYYLVNNNLYKLDLSGVKHQKKVKIFYQILNRIEKKTMVLNKRKYLILYHVM